MRRKITVLGQSHQLTRTLREDDWAEVTSEDGLPGSHLVVIGDAADAADAGRLVARRAPGAVVFVAGDDPKAGAEAALRASLLPRGRVVGLHPDLVRPAAEAVLLARELAVEGAVLVCGELGIEDEVTVVPLVLGAGGVRRIGG